MVNWGWRYIVIPRNPRAWYSVEKDLTVGRNIHHNLIAGFKLFPNMSQTIHQGPKTISHYKILSKSEYTNAFFTILKSFSSEASVNVWRWCLHALQVPRGQRKLHLEGYDRYTDSSPSARIFYERMEASMPDGTRNRTRTKFCPLSPRRTNPRRYPLKNQGGICALKYA